MVEQPQYNLLWRDRVEQEYAPLYDGIGLGLTTWSPLSSGLLTGKYLDGVPEGSRATLPGYEWLGDLLTDPERNEKVRGLQSIAEELDCTLAQLAIAWCAKNPHVSTVITGASRVEQVHENLAALDVVPKLTDDVMARIDAVTQLEPGPEGRRSSAQRPRVALRPGWPPGRRVSPPRAGATRGGSVGGCRRGPARGPGG